MSVKGNACEKFIMVIMSLVFGVFVFGLIAVEPISETKQITVTRGCSQYTEEARETDFKIKNETFSLGITSGLISAFLYPFIAAIVIWYCEVLKSWAYLKQCSSWNRSTKLFFGALWPITFVTSTIIFIFLGIIHRLFKD